MSIYREEAIDTLISCLRNADFPTAQIAAAETIMSLQGRFTTSGKPLTRAFLLKRAGLDKSYKSHVRMDQLSNFSGDDETLVRFALHYLALNISLFSFASFLLLDLLSAIHFLISFLFWLTTKGGGEGG